MLDECRASHYKRIPTKSRTRGNALEDVQSFIYLRRIIINLGGTDADVTARIGKNSRTSGISYFCHNDKKREIHRLNSNIKWVLLYGAEILRMTKTVLNRVQMIINSCLRRILQMSFPDKSNICLWRKFSTNARNRKKNARIDWAHAVTSITRQALTWNHQGKRSKNTWPRCLEANTKKMGLTLGQLEARAQGKRLWRARVATYIM